MDLHLYLPQLPAVTTLVSRATPTRSSRGLLDNLGSALGSLFGTAASLSNQAIQSYIQLVLSHLHPSPPHNKPRSPWSCCRRRPTHRSNNTGQQPWLVSAPRQSSGYFWGDLFGNITSAAAGAITSALSGLANSFLGSSTTPSLSATASSSPQQPKVSLVLLQAPSYLPQ